MPARADRGGELGSADAQPGYRVALQGAQAEHRQLVADLVNPRGVLAGRKPRSATNSAVSAGPHARAQSCWATEDSARWTASTAASRSTQAPGRHSRSVERPPPCRPEDPAHLGQQRVEPGIDRGRVGFSPQRLGQLVAWHLAVAVDDQVGEEQRPWRPGSRASSRWPSRSTTSGPQIWIRTAGCEDAKVTPTSWHYAGRTARVEVRG